MRTSTRSTPSSPIRARREPDAVVVGGDAVPGPFAGETLARLDALSVPVHWVRGNGEREVAEAIGAPAAAPDDWAARTAAITAAELGDDRALALGELALTVQLDGVLFCHASPRRDDEMLTRLSPPERWEQALAGVPAELVVAGHTHQQDDRLVGGVRFVNAGSVGLPYEGDGAARWLWIADGEPELRQTTYDAAGAGARILAAGWPDERSVNAALIDPVEAIVITRIFEEMAGARSDSHGFEKHITGLCIWGGRSSRTTPRCPCARRHRPLPHGGGGVAWPGRVACCGARAPGRLPGRVRAGALRGTRCLPAGRGQARRSPGRRRAAPTAPRCRSPHAALHLTADGRTAATAYSLTGRTS